MKILHIDETFHPSYGYQVNPLARYQRKQGHDVTILTVDKEHLYGVYKDFGDDGSTVLAADMEYMQMSGVDIVRIPTKGYFMHRAIYSKNLFKKIDEINPDVIFVHCVETITGMRFLLKKKKYPLMFDSHMLSMATTNRFAKIYETIYKSIFTRIIKKQRYYVVRTQDDDYVNSHLGIPNELTPFISFGTDTMLYTPSDDVRRAFRKNYCINESDFVVVYTGKLTPGKAGKLLAEAFLKPFNTDKNVVLTIVGNTPDTEYGKEVDAILEKAAVRVLRFPTQKYTDLPQFYQMADLSIFPKQCSLSFYDAQASGLPVLSEDNDINVGRCSHGNGGNFISGNVESFHHELEKYINMPSEALQIMREKAVQFIREGYDYNIIANQYTDYLFKSIQNYKNHRQNNKNNI